MRLRSFRARTLSAYRPGRQTIEVGLLFLNQPEAYNLVMPNTEAITKLLKAHDAGVSAVKANKALLAIGILEEKERPSSKYPDKIKKYKALTEEGLKFGENRESMTSDETTPYYFKDSFPELLARLQAYLKENA